MVILTSHLTPACKWKLIQCYYVHDELVEEDKISSIALAMWFFVGDLCLKTVPKGIYYTWIDIGEKIVSFGIIR